MFMGFIRFVKLFNCVPLPESTQLNDVVGRLAGQDGNWNCDGKLKW